MEEQTRNFMRKQKQIERIPGLYWIVKITLDNSLARCARNIALLLFFIVKLRMTIMKQEHTFRIVMKFSCKFSITKYDKTQSQKNCCRVFHCIQTSKGLSEEVSAFGVLTATDCGFLMQLIIIMITANNICLAHYHH